MAEGLSYTIVEYFGGDDGYRCGYCKNEKGNFSHGECQSEHHALVSVLTGIMLMLMLMLLATGASLWSSNAAEAAVFVSVLESIFVIYHEVS